MLAALNYMNSSNKYRVQQWTAGPVVGDGRGGPDTGENSQPLTFSKVVCRESAIKPRFSPCLVYATLRSGFGGVLSIALPWIALHLSHSFVE